MSAVMHASATHHTFGSHRAVVHPANPLRSTTWGTGRRRNSALRPHQRLQSCAPYTSGRNVIRCATAAVVKFLDIFGYDVVPSRATERGHGADQVEFGSRAGADGHCGWFRVGPTTLHSKDVLVHVTCSTDSRTIACHRSGSPSPIHRRIRRTAFQATAQHRGLVCSEVAEIQPDREPIQLCLRQWICALVFDRIVGRQNDERYCQFGGFGYRCSLALGHCLQYAACVSAASG